MVDIDALTKVFPTTQGGEKRAVDNLSIHLPRGEIYGLLGPNGAGKTTTLRILSGLLSPTSGSARIAGFDVHVQRDEAKRRLGYLTASTGLYQRLTPRETLLFFGRLQGIDEPALAARIDALIAWLDMRTFADLRCGSLSTGQKQRTNIARALVADPPVLIMDEPTLGLDVLTNRVILDFIREEGRRGKTIILSTHYLDEAQSLCNRFGLIHQGKLIAEGDLATLQTLSGRQRLSDIFLRLCGEEDRVLGTPLPALGTSTNAAVAGGGAA